MTKDIILVIGMCALMQLVVFSIGCVEEKKVYGGLGLVKLNANDELNIVNMTVDGIFGEPKLNTVNFELKNELGNIVWSGIPVYYIEIPDEVGVYYIDVNQNDLIDTGDTFCVKAPEDGFFTLDWTVEGINPGRFESGF